MDETDFWQLIDEARDAARGDPDEQADVLIDRLVQLTPEDVVDFARLFEARVRRAYRTDLWGAASLLLETADEEDFEFFRYWLIAQGREVYEGALHHPDALVDLYPGFDPEQDGEAEDVGYVADEAHERLTGLPLPDLGAPPPGRPEGDPFDPADAEQLAKRFPRLWAAFRR